MSEYRPKYTPTEIMTMFEKVLSTQMKAKPSWEKDDETDWVLTRTVEARTSGVSHNFILNGCSEKTAGKKVRLSFTESPFYVEDYFNDNATLLVGYTDIPEDDLGRDIRDAFNSPFISMGVMVDRNQTTPNGIKDVHVGVLCDLYSTFDIDGCYVESKGTSTLDLKSGLWYPADQLGLFELASNIDLEYVFEPSMYEEWLDNQYSVTTIVDTYRFPYGQLANEAGLDWVPDNANVLRFYKADSHDKSVSIIIGVDKMDGANIRVYNPYVRDSNNEPVFTRLCVNQSQELLPELVRGFETEKGRLTPNQRQSIVDVSYMNDDDTDFQYITSVPEGLQGTSTIQVDVHEYLGSTKSLYVTRVLLTDKEDYFNVREAFDVDNVPEKIESYGTFDSLLDFKRAYQEGLIPEVVQIGVRKEKEPEPVVEDDGFELE